MNFNQIHYFLTIEKTKSFSEAAFELYISQSSLSKQIKALEDELGIKLFQRNSNMRTLTPEGRVFYRYASDVYARHFEMLNELEKLRIDRSNILRFGNIPIMPMYMNFNIGKELARFQKEYPEDIVTLDSYETSQMELLKDISNGYADVGLVRLERIPDTSTFDVQLVTDDEIVLVCHKNHSASQLQIAGLHAIKDYTFFHLGSASELQQLITEAFGNEGIKIKLRGDSLRPRIIMGLISEGEDIALIPRNIVDLKSFPDLVIIPLEKPIYSHIALIRSNQQKHTKVANAFWEFNKRVLPIPKGKML